MSKKIKKMLLNLQLFSSPGQLQGEWSQRRVSLAAATAWTKSAPSNKAGRGFDWPLCQELFSYTLRTQQEEREQWGPL